MLIPLYDNEDSVCGICFNGEYFYFQKNLQGDIISVTDKDATEVAKYTYDAWGVCTIVSDSSACSIAAINPFRYRGYYYDSEIGLYYLRSRYYDPVCDRFLNKDVPTVLGLSILDCEEPATNLYSYCANNPVMYIDPVGMWKIPLSAVKNLIALVGLNPIAATIIAIGVYKLKTYLTLKFTLFIAKLGAFWGPVVQTVLVALAAITGIFILGPIASGMFDALVQGKKGVEIKVKKTWFGMPYGLEVGTY